MSDVAQGPGWWQANDGRWYPPQPSPSTAPAPTVGEPLGVAEPLGVSEPLGSVSFPATTPGAEPSYGWAEPSSGFVTVYRSRTIGLLLILLGLAGIVLGIGLLTTRWPSTRSPTTHATRRSRHGPRWPE